MTVYLLCSSTVRSDVALISHKVTKRVFEQFLIKYFNHLQCTFQLNL